MINHELINLFMVTLLFAIILWVIHVMFPMLLPLTRTLVVIAVMVMVIYFLQYFGLIVQTLPVLSLI